MDIKLTKHDKRYIEGTDDVYSIMQRVLLRDNQIDQEKEHLWMIGMNQAGYILYIELIALGSYKSVDVEPMNVFRVAVMKNASRVILVHNHPSGSLTPSEADKDITDRLIQVGRILNIDLIDHLIITPKSYISFRSTKLMDELEQSLKYVPTYQVVERIRKEEKLIAKEKLAVANNKIKAEKDKTKAEKEQKEAALAQAKALANALLNKGVDIETIAKLMEVTPKKVERILGKVKDN
ncbi:JAB domain-containing protein [Gilliamella sp. B2838]|uniref:JAB domain-containing protein n=1 Tax=Gilliamella sp. B2838 TaxID=2818020 RepID=UPI00226AFBE4|nr:JAB domain-containing protein [Gilliamella sp. B2838]MCX8727557.1 JAB domain-containing protein [Gilliamella sp. B2838]